KRPECELDSLRQIRGEVSRLPMRRLDLAQLRKFRFINEAANILQVIHFHQQVAFSRRLAADEFDAADRGQPWRAFTARILPRLAAFKTYRIEQRRQFVE